MKILFFFSFLIDHSHSFDFLRKRILTIASLLVNTGLKYPIGTNLGALMVGYSVALQPGILSASFIRDCLF